MKKKICLILMFFTLILLAGCSITREDQKGEKKTEKTRQASAGKENTIVWAVREDAKVSEKNIQKTNQLLAKKGYDLAIKVKKLKADRIYEKQEIYHNALEKSVKAGEVDVAYVDACYETAQGEMAQYLKSGLFYPLNKWLHSGEGQVVYRLYDKEVWKGSSVDGENYVLPNEIYYDIPEEVIAFRKDHVSQKLIKSWDGSWNDLFRIMEKVRLSKDDMMVTGYPMMDYFEGRVKKRRYMIDDDIVYNIQNQTVHQPFELKEFYEYLSFLHKCYQKGYITHAMEDIVTSQDEIEHLARGEYAMAWTAEECLKPSEHVFARRSLCVRGILGEGTAISAYSDKKEKALKLMKILRTDDEIANTLIWGEGEAAKLLDGDGYVKKSIERVSDRSAFGLNDGIFQQKEEDVTPVKNMREYRNKWIHYTPRTTSHMLGFWPDYSSFYEELTEYQQVLGESVNCFQEKDFDKAYQEAAERVAEAWKPMKKKLQRQIREWKNNK